MILDLKPLELQLQNLIPLFAKKEARSNFTKISSYYFLNDHIILTTPVSEIILSWESYIKSTVSNSRNSGGTLEIYEKHSCEYLIQDHSSWLLIAEVNT